MTIKVAQLHQKALVAISNDDRARTTKQIDQLQTRITDEMDNQRQILSRIATETKQLRGPEVQSRKSQQSTAAKKLMQIARKYEDVQEKCKMKYKQRVARELKIGTIIFIFSST